MSVQANIHPDAQIGKGTVIEAFATVQGMSKLEKIAGLVLVRASWMAQELEIM